MSSENTEVNMTMMMTIRISDIPYWQRDSIFFDNLLDCGSLEDTITIPSRFIRENNMISTLDDFIAVYNISAFFMVRFPCDSLLKFVMSAIENDDTYENLKREHSEMNSDWWDIFDIVHYTGDGNKEGASFLFAQQGNICMIDFYGRHGLPISSQHCIEASVSNKNCLEYCIQKVNPDESTFRKCFKTAIRNKNMDCLEYLFELIHETMEKDAKFSYIACESDNLDALVFLHENGFPWDEVTYLHSRYSLECLQYLVENGYRCDFRELLYRCGPACYKYVSDKFVEQYQEDLEEEMEYEVERPYDARPY